MLNGAMLVWYVLTIPSVIFVAVDIRKTPEATVLKWAFVILTVFTGPLGAFFYVLGCREPMKGMHAGYVAARWRQVLGSTMHCAAGDGVGIIVGGALASALGLTFWPDFALEYVLGFGFGWAFFQAFAMRDMAGGSYSKALRMTFLPEFLSMNLLMAGMQVVSKPAMAHLEGAMRPTQLGFWFIMSMALIVGFAFAYPMNWWLVSRHMKHGMFTVTEPMSGMGQPETAPAGAGPGMAMSSHGGDGHGAHEGHAAAAGEAHLSVGHSQPEGEGHAAAEGPGTAAVAGMTVFSLLVLAAGLWAALLLIG